MDRTLKIFKDKARTRIDLKSVTSYAQEHDIIHGSKSFKVFVLILSIGSAIAKLTYNTEQDRDEDVCKLDAYYGVINE